MELDGDPTVRNARKTNLSAFLVIAGFIVIFLIFSASLSAATENRLRKFVGAVSRKLDINEANSMGNSSFIFNKTIYGAVILTDYSDQLHKKNVRHVLVNSTTVAGKKLKASQEISDIRSKNALKMISQLPFPVVHWPPVFAKACPYSHSQHKTERGLTFAHYRIWLDFVYFDHEVLELSKTKDRKREYELDESYKNGIFFAAENGTLFKNGSPYRDQNVIIIFEDDADIAVVNVQEALKDELENMTTDLLFLGWCVGRLAKPVPLCAHAYALTLEGARKMIKYLEPCGKALDEQFVMMAKNNWITYRIAHTSNYVNKFNSDYPKQHDNTFGIFHQKHMGSFNGH